MQNQSRPMKSLPMYGYNWIVLQDCVLGFMWYLLHDVLGFHVCHVLFWGMGISVANVKF